MADYRNQIELNAFVQQKVREAERTWTIWELWAAGSATSDDIEASSEKEVEEAISKAAGVPFCDLERYDAHHDDGHTGGFDPEISGQDSEGNKFYAFPSRRVFDYWEGFGEEIEEHFPGIPEKLKEEIQSRVADNLV